MSERTYTLADFADEVNIEHPLAAKRIPVLTDVHSKWKYHIALVIGQPSWMSADDGGVEPEEFEIEQLLVYLEKTMRYYNDSYRRKVEARGPFDVDGTVNTHTFRKHLENGWQYNLATWIGGPTWFPTRPWHLVGPYSLEQLLDHINTFGDGPPMQKWLDLKVESGAFSGQSI